MNIKGINCNWIIVTVLINLKVQIVLTQLTILVKGIKSGNRPDEKEHACKMQTKNRPE